MTTPELVSVGTAARMLGVSDDTIRRWADSGQLPAIVLPSGHRRFQRTDVEALLSAARSDKARA